jgi:mRNA-degrading endonuclease RelE of RelBE toxin-antitoxin system
MRYELILAPEARDALERHLRYEPTRVSKSRIKRLRGVSQPQYRLRVGEVRVFYDVTSTAVEILAIVTKAEAADWLAEHGTPDAPGGARRG